MASSNIMISREKEIISAPKQKTFLEHYNMFRRALHPSLSAKTPLPWMDETEFHQVFRLWILYFHPRVQAPANIHFAQCLQIYVESRGAPSYCQPVSMDDATEALRRLEILWESYVHDSPLSEKVQKASRDALNENYEHRLREQERENARGNIVKIVQDVKVFEKALAATPKIASRPAVGVPVAAVVKETDTAVRATNPLLYLATKNPSVFSSSSSGTKQ